MRRMIVASRTFWTSDLRRMAEDLLDLLNLLDFLAPSIDSGATLGVAFRGWRRRRAERREGRACPLELARHVRPGNPPVVVESSPRAGSQDSPRVVAHRTSLRGVDEQGECRPFAQPTRAVGRRGCYQSLAVSQNPLAPRDGLGTAALRRVRTCFVAFVG